MFSRQVIAADQSVIFDLIVPNLIASNHKQVVRLAAHEIAKSIGVSERILAERLADQEKENSPAIGDGVAVSHLQISGLQESMNVFVRLKNPVSMNAPDNRDVDLVCYILTPEREGTSYLRTMARVSRLLRDADICGRLRAASDEKEIAQVFDQSTSQLLAA